MGKQGKQQVIKVVAPKDSAVGAAMRTALGVGVFSLWAAPAKVLLRGGIDLRRVSHVASLGAGALTWLGAARIVRGRSSTGTRVTVVDNAELGGSHGG